MNDLESQPTLFLVYTVHLDTQWRWTVRDSIKDFIPATLGGNFELFAEYPERVLSFEGAFRYRLIEEYYPEDFARLRQAVERGQWRPAGSMLDSPDVNCVAPESLLRHILYATRYFESRFGLTSEDLFLPDCFGFGHALPTIAAHSGLRGFSAQKFGNWSGSNPLPFHVGRWLGPDGEGIVAAIRPEGYGEGLGEDLSRADRWSERIERQAAASGLAIAFMYVGLGDRGGRLGEDSLDWIERSVQGDGPVRVLQTGSDVLFRSLTREQIEDLPTHQGELLLPTHGTGCWTSQAAAKRWNRDCERTADAAERAAVIADCLGAMRYPATELREAWERFLWHQMHDDLTGTSIPEAYRFTWNDQLISRNQFRVVLADAVASIARRLDTTAPGLPVAVFNPFERRRTELLEVTVDWPGAPLAIEARGPGGEAVPVQILERSGERLEVVFAPEMAALSVGIWHFRPARDPQPASDLEITESGIANSLYRLALNDRGEVASLVDRRSGEECLSAPLRLELLPDRSARWPAWEIHRRDIEAAPRAVAGRPRVSILEAGPVRAVVEVRRRHRGSTFRQRILLGRGEAGRAIEFEQTVDWRTRGRLLKVALRQAVATKEAVYGLGCGTIRRPINSPGKYEVPGLWAAPTEGGLALIAPGQAGWDHPSEETLRLSLLRSPRVVRKFRHQGVQDLGRHRMSYWVTHHDSLESTEEQAVRSACPPHAWQVDRHDGGLGRVVSLLEVEPGAVVRALKKREAGDGYVVRLQESGGRSRPDHPLRTTTPLAVEGLQSGCERRLGELEGSGDMATVDLPAWGLKTLAFTRPDAGPDPATTDFEPLALACDTRTTSAQGEAGVRVDAGGRSLPADLWPPHIQSGAVPFELGPKEEPNAVSSAGQTLEWRSDARRVDLLAASVDQGREVHFRVHGRQIRLQIDRWDGIVGCFKGWRRGFKHLAWASPGGGFERPSDIGWVATHRHDEQGEDLPYDYGYLYHYRIDLSPGERSLTLPDLPSVLLFAATLVK